MIASLTLLIGTLAFALGQDCAPLPASAEFWSTEQSGEIRNNAEGALQLAFEADGDSLVAAFGTRFSEPQDLTAHSLFSFNLYKVHQPVSVYLSVVTPHGEHRTEAANLFEGQNTITVDFASSEFSTDAEPEAFDQPIVGLSEVSELRLYLVATELGHGEASVDSMMICAAVHDDDTLVEPSQDEQAASETPKLTYGGVPELSSALEVAIGEVARLSGDLDGLRAQQHKIERSFQEFGVRTRDTLEKAVEALSSAMSTNVDQTVTNAKLLQRLREQMLDVAREHDNRLAQLDAEFESLRTLGGLQPGESIDEAVARTNAAEAEQELGRVSSQLKKRSIEKQEVLKSLEREPAKAVPVADAFHIAAKKRAASKPVVPSP